ncbi:hypothetical protein FSP39_021193 [Pinctada imbricata]|uniref:Uncharacterized protein n=1 Tax=Pinctada imbricata TaxID=66713 RepID=A0AA88YBE4_PINIB|nr:hypothetical protein FSP39_021193 [Pinctada imbricata]
MEKNKEEGISPGLFRVKYWSSMKALSNWAMFEKELNNLDSNERKNILKKSFCQKEIDETLLRACERGLLSAVRYLVEKCNVDIRKDGRKERCLWTAVSFGNLNVAKYLVENFAPNVNWKDDEEVSVVHSACVNGNLPLVVYLLKHGGDITTKDNKKSTCLMAGAFSGVLQICKLAVQKGVSVNAKTTAGQTAIHSAIMNRAPLEVVEYLDSAGADLNCVNAQNIPIVIYAALKIKDIRQDSTKVLGYLLKNSKVKMADKIIALKYAFAVLKGIGNEPRGYKFLTRALQLQEMHNVGKLGENGHKVDTDYEFVNQDLTSVEEVKELKKDPVKGSKYMLGLYFRMHLQYGYNNLNFFGNFLNDFINLRFAELFLNAYAFLFHHTFCGDENVRDLPHVFYSGFLFKIIRLKAKSDDFLPLLKDFLRRIVSSFNYRNKKCTRIVPALHHLSQSQNSKMPYVEVHALRNLIEAPFDLSTDTRHKFLFMRFIIELLSLTLELYQGERDFISSQVRQLIKFNFLDERGSTFLHIAIQNIEMPHYDKGTPGPIDEEFQVEIAKMFIEEGSPVNAMDHYMFTPAHVLGSSGYVCRAHEIAELLIEHDAHLDYRSLTGESALESLEDYALIDEDTIKYQRLQCLAAEVINEHDIPYTDKVPKALCGFIEKHNPNNRIFDGDIPDFFEETMEDVPDFYDDDDDDDNDDESSEEEEPHPEMIEQVKRSIERIVGKKIYD